MPSEKSYPITWQRVVLEILFLFVGISAAVWFNNMNEAQKARIVEIKSLDALEKAIGQDLHDIEENISGFSFRSKLYQAVLDELDGGNAFSDSLRSNLLGLLSISVFYPNRAPYETLKSRGLESISNDSLRLKISTYYEFDYSRLQIDDKMHFQHNMDFLKPLLMENFNFMAEKGPRPHNHVQLAKNERFRQVLWLARMLEQYASSEYQSIHQTGIRLGEEIREEITRLKSS